MSMNVCKDCGTELSSKAKICPKCGLDQRNFYSKHKVLMLILAIICLGAIGTAAGGGSSKQTVITSNSNTVQGTSPQQIEKKVNVGGTVQTNQVKITYRTASDYTKYNSYSKPKEGNKVIRAEFEFENISNSDIYLENVDCYADGEKCEAYYYADDYKAPTLESLSSGKKLKVTLYYEVPKTAQEVILEYSTNYWTSEKIEFVVQ